MSQVRHAAHYRLEDDRAVHHWLACGPVTSALEALADAIAPDGSPFGVDRRWVLNYWAWSQPSIRLKRRVYERLPPFEWSPGAHPSLHSPGIGGKTWRYAQAEEDQVIDFSLFNFTPTLMQGWLFALLEADADLIAEAQLLTIGPVRVFLNGTLHLHDAETFSYVALRRVLVRLPLKRGQNALYLHGEMLGWREARLALGLRFLDAYPIAIHLPLGDIESERWHRAQAGLEALQVKQFAFPALPGYVALDVRAAEPFAFRAEVELPVPENVFAQLATRERPRAHADITLAPGERAALPITPEVTEAMSGMPGENSLSLRLTPADGTPLTIERDIWASRNTYSHAPYGDYEGRRREALEHLAAMPYDVLAALAALELGTRAAVPSEAVALACHFMEHRYDCADFYAIGLLALLYRYGDHPALRPQDRQRIEAAFLGFKYWIDEPGLDAMCYFTENHQVLFHTAGYLAGQFWPDRVFSNSGRSGREQMARQRPRIENWILRRLRGGFSEWDSNAYLALDIFAMLALVEFAASPRLRELAAALLDLIFFMIACQSFRGAHSSTHGRCYVAALKSARVENTSSLQRIAWGMGIFNGETRATGLLALARRYRVPSIIQRIGADVGRVLITRARAHAQFRPHFDMRGDDWDVRTLTYRAPEVMLSAALDHRPGAMGIQEHLWQATLGPDAAVFTTYPGNSQEHGNARPNFWAGSARLPRVALHERTVICLYRIEPEVGLGFSHAYFPAAMFDEWRIDGQWAFARLGAGYIALWSDGNLRLADSGQHVAQELRSGGPGRAWLCRVGRAAEDGAFADFVRSVMQNAPQPTADGLRWQSPGGETLALEWTGDFTVDERPQQWGDYPYYQNAYTDTALNAELMQIAFEDEMLTLDLKRGRVRQTV